MTSDRHSRTWTWTSKSRASSVTAVVTIIDLTRRQRVARSRICIGQCGVLLRLSCAGASGTCKRLFRSYGDADAGGHRGPAWQQPPACVCGRAGRGGAAFAGSEASQRHSSADPQRRFCRHSQPVGSRAPSRPAHGTFRPRPTHGPAVSEPPPSLSPGLGAAAASPNGHPVRRGLS